MPLIVCCLGTHDNVSEIFDSVQPHPCTALVDLTTGTPEDVERLNERISALDVAYLDGAILADPQHIGSEQSAVPVAGSTEAFTSHAPILGVLGQGVRYLSGSVSDPNVNRFPSFAPTLGLDTSIGRGVLHLGTDGVDRIHPIHAGLGSRTRRT